MAESRKCHPGCTCGRHKLSACQSGCTCKRHGDPYNKGATCLEGCTCKRHSPSKRPKRTREEQLRVDRERKQQIRAADPSKHREANRRYYAKNPYWFKYRMTTEQWEQLFERQEGCCYLCEDPLRRDDFRAVHVDHDHTCCPAQRTCGNCVRGLTCSDCNVGISALQDDPDLMLQIADRLEACMHQRGSA